MNAGELARPSRRARRCRFANHIWLTRRIDCASVGSAALRQREWNRAHSDKQKKIKCASDKMRFDGGINLFFHFGLVLVRILIFANCKTILCKPDTRSSGTRAKMSILFSSFLKRDLNPRIVRITRMRFWSAATCRRFESSPRRVRPVAGAHVSAHSKESTPKNPVPVAPSFPLFPSVECFFCRLMFAHSTNRLPSSFATANLRSEKPIDLCWDGT